MNITSKLVLHILDTCDNQTALEKNANELDDDLSAEKLAEYIHKTAEAHPLHILEYEISWHGKCVLGQYRNDSDDDSLELLKSDITELLGDE